MKTLRLATAAALLALLGPAQADEALAREKQCFGCHAIEKDEAAPAFRRIGARWKGKADAESKMVATIRQGSAGTGGPHWNKATMPDQSERPLVSDAEARRLAAWIVKL